MSMSTNGGTLSDWIKCTDQMPETRLGMGHHVLCCTQTGLRIVGWTIYGRWYLGHGWADELGYEVTHWTPIPEPPTA